MTVCYILKLFVCAIREEKNLYRKDHYLQDLFMIFYYYFQLKVKFKWMIHDFFCISNLEFWSELELLIFQPISISRVA